MKALFDPIRLGEIDCVSRIAMAPCTRCFCPGFLPTAEVADYYGRRADDGVGLLISEGTVIAERGNGYNGAPGIWSREQVAAWRPVTDRVHAGGGRIICQIWHVGAVAHPLTTGGVLPEGPSGVSPEGRISRLRKDDGSFEHYGESEAMTPARVAQAIDLYRRAAANAMEAGFDGVEIHGAHGYLIDQFVNLHFNRRDDDWGGENRCRFAGEVTRAVVGEIGAGRTVYRFRADVSQEGRGWQRPLETLPLLLETLRDAGLEILHASNWEYDEAYFPTEDGSAGEPLHAATRRLWPGPLIGVGSLTAERADAALAAGEIDMAAFGRALIANPDFVSRVREGRPLNPYEAESLAKLD